MRAIDFLAENKITLHDLYKGDFPDRNETFWDYVQSDDFDKPLEIQTLPKHKLQMLLLSQYRIEHLDELFDLMDDDQKETVDRYTKDPNLSNHIILLGNDRIIDGNHRALAAALKGVPIRYVDLSDLDDELDEAEKRTPASKEIRTQLRRAGYKLLGEGVDATVWAKKTGPVVKIIMPDDLKGAGTAGDIFMKFYEFCVQNQQYENLPRFSGNEAEVFQIDGKDYVMATMERLQPIPMGSFQEAMVWILSDLATKKISWIQALEVMRDESTWQHYDGMPAVEVLTILDRLDDRDLLKLEVLFKLMTVLYHKGRINKIGWDLHTENAMMRGDTIVITDPWFSVRVD